MPDDNNPPVAALAGWGHVRNLDGDDSLPCRRRRELWPLKKPVQRCTKGPVSLKPLGMNKKFVATMDAFLENAKLVSELAPKQAAYVSALRDKGFTLDEAIAEAQRAIPIPSGPSIADIDNSISSCVAPGVYMASFSSDRPKNSSFFGRVIAYLRSLFK